MFVNLSESDLIDDHTDNNPIDQVYLGQNGRVQELEATIKKCHLRPRGAPRRSITARVRRFVNSLGQVNSSLGELVREKWYSSESDEVGHIVADCLGGPHDRTYNFFPQSPFCNNDYYHKMEKAIYDYLDASKPEDNLFVYLHIEFVYVDYIKGVSPNRPRKIKVSIMYSNGVCENFEMSNM